MKENFEKDIGFEENNLNLPEEVKFLKEITVGGKDIAQLTKEMKQLEINGSDSAPEIDRNASAKELNDIISGEVEWSEFDFDGVKTSKEQEPVKLVKISVGDLLPHNLFPESFDEIYELARDEYGLKLCSPEMALNLRLQYLDQPNNEKLFIAMETTDKSDRGVFTLENKDGKLLIKKSDESGIDPKSSIFVFEFDKDSKKHVEYDSDVKVLVNKIKKMYLNNMEVDWDYKMQFLRTAEIFSSADASEKTKISALEELGGLELNDLKEEEELLEVLYKKEKSPKVRAKILSDLDVHALNSVSAIDTIVNAAKSDSEESVRKEAIKLLKNSKKEGYIDEALKGDDSIIKNRYKKLVEEMKELGIK